MPFTRLQYQTRIQANLGDQFGVYQDALSVQDSIQDGYDEILCDTQCAEASVNVQFAGSTVYYDLYNLVPDPAYMRPIKLFNTATKRWLPVVDVRVLDSIRLDWENARSSSWFAYVINFQFLAFFPHKGDGSFDLLYKVCPDVLLSDAQALQIPDGYNKVLENYCMADLLESAGEPKKAAGFWAAYEKDAEDLRISVASRMQPDLMTVLEDLS